MDISEHREYLIDALMADHVRRGIERWEAVFGETPSVAHVSEENESYRPYAAADVDAIIAALSNL